MYYDISLDNGPDFELWSTLSNLALFSLWLKWNGLELAHTLNHNKSRFVKKEPMNFLKSLKRVRIRKPWTLVT